MSYRHSLFLRFPSLVVHLFVLTVLFCLTARGQGTAISYQGRLMGGGGPVNGNFDLVFAMYDTNSAGNLVGGPITNMAVTVSNGLFQTTLDFGNAFTGTSCWLQISVRTNGGTTFTTLMPRQGLTPTPYAIYAESAASLAIGGTVNGNGAGLTKIPASSITGLGTAAAAGTNSIVAMAAAIYGNSQGISDLALESAKPAYHDGWLDEPIGFNTWFSIGPGINEFQITNSMLPWMMGQTGHPDMRKMLAPKKPYFQIDDGLFTGFDSSGIPTVDPAKFPDGFPWLANYLHTNGFAVGIWMQAFGGSFNTQMTNYDADVFANYLITNHVDYVKFDGVNNTIASFYPYSDYNTNAVALFSYLRTAPYPIYLNSAIGGATNGADYTEAITLLDSFRCTTDIGFDPLGNYIIGDINPGGQRPVLQNQWVDGVMQLSPFLGNGLAPDFDPISSGNWPDAKRHLSICTFFSSPFQFAFTGVDEYGGFESVWTNLLSQTSIKIRRDQFTPYLVYTTNGVAVFEKQNTDGGIDVLLLNRNYQPSLAPGVVLGNGSYGPGYQMDLFTNYFQQNGTNFQYVFRSTNVMVDFAALGLRGGAYSCYNAASDGRLTVTNGLNLTIPAASAQLLRIVPPVMEAPYRYLTMEKWFEYTNCTTYPNYPYYNSFLGNSTVSLAGSSQIFSNGMVISQGSKLTFGVNGARAFSAGFGRMTYNSAYTNNVTIFLDGNPVAYFNTGTFTNFSCVIPPGTQTISLQGDSAGLPYCMVLPLLSSAADGSYFTGLTAVGDGSAGGGTISVWRPAIFSLAPVLPAGRRPTASFRIPPIPAMAGFGRRQVMIQPVRRCKRPTICRCSGRQMW